MDPVEMSFKSEVMASPERVWEHVTSFRGISREMKPVLRMTVPPGVASISDLKVTPGEPLFRSWLFLLGVFPAGCMRLTLIEFEEGAGFVEQSPMTGMKLWRHERRIIPAGSGCIVTDRLTFEPMWARAIASRCVRFLFNHRHRILRRELGEASQRRE
jgi:ligand-binding SRPBCC domain-containing protein